MLTPYIFYLHDGPDHPPEFVVDLCGDLEAAKVRATALLAERPRYKFVEISLAEESLATVTRD